MVKYVRLPDRSFILVVMVASVVAMSGCSHGNGFAVHPFQDQPAPAGNSTRLTWLFAKRALNQVLVDADVRTRLGQLRIFEIVPVEQPPQVGPELVPTAKFSSYASLKQTLADGSLPSWVRAVLYDNEAWSFTPEVEQRAPGRYMAMAAELVHRHHLLFLASPGLGLTTVLRPDVTRRAAAYLKLGLAAQAATAADVVNIQAQSLERSIGAYVDFVKQAAAQARRAHRGITVLAGISSNPSGAPVSAAQLKRAVAGARPYVDGYWMNIPSPGPACPRCNPSRPDLAITAIRTLSH